MATKTSLDTFNMEAWGSSMHLAQTNQQIEQLMGEIENLKAARYPKTSFEDLWLYPGWYLSIGLKVPNFTKYEGRGCPHMHLQMYFHDMAQLGKDKRLIIHLFASSLEGQALKWFWNLNKDKLQT